MSLLETVYDNMELLFQTAPDPKQIYIILNPS